MRAPRSTVLLPVDRIMVAAVGVFDVFAATRMWRLADVGTALAPAGWMVWFAVAGVVTILFAVIPDRASMVGAGTLTITACAARFVAVAAAMLENRARANDSRLQLAAGLWLVLAVVLYWVWTRVLRGRVNALRR